MMMSSTPHKQEHHEILVPIGSETPPPSTSRPPAPLNIPRLQLIEGSREDYIEIAVPLYEASIKGDWKAAKAILDENPELVRFAITDNYETPLHIASSAKNTMAVEEFIKNLMSIMPTSDLELQNRDSNTAFSLAAGAGNVKAAKIMLAKNKALVEIPGSGGMMPLYVAALFGRADMVRYLYRKANNMCGEFWTDQNRGWVLQKCVEADLFDVAIRIVNDDGTKLTSNKRLLTDVLLLLAQKSDAFKEKKLHMFLRIIKSYFRQFNVNLGDSGRETDALNLLRTIWRRIAIMPKNEIYEIIRGPPLVIEEQQQKTTTYPSQVLFVAAKMGNTRFIIELMRSYPDLVMKINDKGQTIFHVAVKHRRAKIYSLLYEIGAMKELITSLKDVKGNNMLHLVANTAKPQRLQNVSGVALQMQRELLWFKEIEKIIPPGYKQRKNKDGETPYDIFTKKHKDLVADGEAWMKNTSSHCMVVAALIATIVFVAALILPRGYDQDSPVFRWNLALIVFVIADAISLIFSSASVLMFLSILTSRYAERDFLESLPKKLMFGLATLFVSILTMMVAFSASFFLLYHKNLNWIPIMVTGFAGLPVILFAIGQFYFLRDVFYSTYQSRYLFKPMKDMLYC